MTAYKTLDQEIEETLQALQNDTQNPNLYIHVAKLYSYQGQQQEAISILKQAISSSTMRSDHTLLLQQQLSIVTERLGRRIDFITSSPMEIVITIANQLKDDQETLITCLTVCRLWRSKFLEHGNPLWHSLHVHGTPPKKKLLKALPIISKHIKRLYMYPGPKPGNILSGLLETHDFSNLQMLSVTYKKGARNVDYCHNQYIMNALSCIGHQLTGLDLFVGKETELSLKQILLGCPKLESIKLNVHASLGEDLTATRTIVQTPTSLIKIELIVRRRIYNLSDIVPLFDYTPHLQQLILYNMSSRESLLTVIGDRCPDLVEVRIGNHQYDSIVEKQHSKTRPVIKVNKGEKQQGGLQCLELHTGNLNSLVPIASRLEKSSHSLKKLLITLSTHNETATLTDWQPLSSITMHNLTVFSLSIPCESFYMHLPLILPRFPALESLYLGFPGMFNLHRSFFIDDERTNDGIFDAIGQLTKLTKVHLSSVNVDGQGFKRWLTKMMLQDVSSNSGLRNLKLFRCKGFNSALLSDIAMIHSLQSLLLIDFYEAWKIQDSVADEAMINVFQEALTMLVTTLSNLSKLELDSVPMTLDTVQHMIYTKSLCNLKLGVNVQYHGCTKQDVRKLVNKEFKGTKKIC